MLLASTECWTRQSQLDAIQPVDFRDGKKERARSHTLLATLQDLVALTLSIDTYGIGLETSNYYALCAITLRYGIYSVRVWAGRSVVCVKSCISIQNTDNKTSK